MPQVRIYACEDGRRPFSEWADELDGRASAKVNAALARLEAGNPGDSRGVGGGVLERRIHAGPGYRLYYGRDGDALVVLLVGGTKRGQSRDVAVAKQLWADYRRRKEAGENPLTEEDSGEAAPRDEESSRAPERGTPGETQPQHDDEE